MEEAAAGGRWMVAIQCHSDLGMCHCGQILKVSLCPDFECVIIVSRLQLWTPWKEIGRLKRSICAANRINRCHVLLVNRVVPKHD